MSTETRTLENSDISGTRKNVRDVKIVGNVDLFQLLCKASSESQNFMKACKAMEIPGVGCVVQVTTLDQGKPAEAICFVPHVKVVDDENEGRKLTPSFPPPVEAMASDKTRG